MFCIVAYDIENDRNRNKIAKILKDYGERVQKSVFECNINENMLNRMLKRVEKFIDLETDNFRVYKLFDSQKTYVTIIGKGKVIEDDKDVYIV
jgi:CRISPR-associated protein Cas2